MKKELIKIAEMDLQAARELHRNKLYPQSIFYFQQSVEKSTKAFLLFLGKIKENELRKIGHLPIKLYEQNLRETMERYEKFKKMCRTFPKLKSVVGKGINQEIKEMASILTSFEEMKKDMLKFIHMPSTFINHIIKEIKKVSSEMEKPKKTKIRIGEKDFEEIKKKMKKDCWDLFKDIIPKKDFEKTIEKLTLSDIKKKLKATVNTIASIMPIYAASYGLSVITLPHAIHSRYPEKINPLKVYNKRLPIVKLLPKLISTQEKTIKKLKVLIKI